MSSSQLSPGNFKTLITATLSVRNGARAVDFHKAAFSEVRRHAQLLHEDTRGDIRVVADAVAHLTMKVDALAAAETCSS